MTASPRPLTVMAGVFASGRITPMGNGIRLAVVAFLDRVARLSLIAFLCGLAMLVGVVIIDPTGNAALSIATIIIALFLIFASGFVQFASVLARIAALGTAGQFSLRTLLIATTLVAVVLGLVVWAIR